MSKNHKKCSSALVKTQKIIKLINSKKLIGDLWLEILSDIKEKPTYIRLKGMVKAAIDDELKTYILEDNSNSSERKEMIKNISFMAYAFDRVIFDALHKTVQDEMGSLIRTMMHDIKEDKQAREKGSDFSMLENIENLFTSISENQGNPISNGDESSKSQAKQMTKSQCSSTTYSKNVKSPRMNVKKKKKAMNSSNGPSLSFSGIKVEIDEGKDSGSVSDGNQSVASISSIATTDLSSFDDTVSVCSLDEKGKEVKKRISLKKANDLVLKRKFPNSFYVQDKSKESTKGNSQVAPTKELPKRKRKPNTKYTMDTVLHKKKNPSVHGKESSNPADDLVAIESKVQETAKERKTNKVDRTKTNQIETKVSTKRTHSPSAENWSLPKADSDTGSPSKVGKFSAQRYDKSDLYKPRINFGRP